MSGKKKKKYCCFFCNTSWHQHYYTTIGQCTAFYKCMTRNLFIVCVKGTHSLGDMPFVLVECVYKCYMLQFE